MRKYGSLMAVLLVVFYIGADFYTAPLTPVGAIKLSLGASIVKQEVYSNGINDAETYCAGKVFPILGFYHKCSVINGGVIGVGVNYRTRTLVVESFSDKDAAFEEYGRLYFEFGRQRDRYYTGKRLVSYREPIRSSYFESRLFEPYTIH